MAPVSPEAANGMRLDSILLLCDCMVHNGNGVWQCDFQGYFDLGTGTIETYQRAPLRVRTLLSC